MSTASQLAVFLPKPLLSGLPRPLPSGVSDCWLWQGSLHPQGYPIAEGRSAVRWMYALHKGKLSRIVNVRQTCGVTRCVNPDHLVLEARRRLP